MRIRRHLRFGFLLLLLGTLLAVLVDSRQRPVGEEVVWTAPTADEVSMALGSVEELSERQRRLHSPVGHEVKRPPERGDWLANHWEAGQSYSDFVGSGANKPDATRRKLVIQPMGPFEAEHFPILRQVADFGERFFQLDVELQPPIEIPVSTTRRRREATGREQLLTTDLMEFLKADLPGDAYCRIGVTMSDLYPEPSRNYVFGQASIHDRVGVYSFARYDRRFFDEQPLPGDDVLFLKRCLWVFSHEVGHMFGMRHCIFYECLMNGANNLREGDSHPPHLCPVCLRKLAHSSGFDPIVRYESLASFYEAHALTDEARWIRSRLLWIKDGIEPAAHGVH